MCGFVFFLVFLFLVSCVSVPLSLTMDSPYLMQSQSGWTGFGSGMTIMQLYWTLSSIGSMIMFTGINGVNADNSTLGNCTGGAIAGSGGCVCNTGMFFNVSRCSACLGGYFSNSFNATGCNGCVAGTYSSVGASMCSLCAPGTYGTFAYSTGCSICAAGNYSLAGMTTCTSCRAGTYSLGNSSSCINCPGGLYGNHTGMRNASCDGICPAGYFCPSGTASYSANLCNPGTYSTAGSSACLGCPPGTYGNASGLTSSTCMGKCPAGYYCPLATALATQFMCERNLCSDVGSSNCSQCSPWSACGYTGCNFFRFNNSHIFVPLNDISFSQMNNNLSWAVQFDFRLSSIIATSYQYLFSKPGANFSVATSKESSFEFALRLAPNMTLQLLMGCSLPSQNISSYLANGTAFFFYSNLGTINDTLWHNLALSYQPNMVLLYIDNTLIRNISFFPTCGPLWGGTVFYLGSGSNTSGYGGYFFSGDMMDARVWKTSISSSLVSATSAYNIIPITYQTLLYSWWLLNGTTGNIVPDYAGRSPGMASVPLWVHEDIIPPWITGLFPISPSGLYSAGLSIVIGVSFSEPVLVYGQPYIYLQLYPLNTTAIAVYTSGSGYSLLYFTYFPAQTDFVSNLMTSTAYLSINVSNVNWITDLMGNVADTRLPPTGTLNTLGYGPNVITVGCPSCQVPDSTSILTCPLSALAGVTFNCSIQANNNGINVTVVPNAMFTLSMGGTTAVTGSFSTIYPYYAPFGTILTFNFTSTLNSSGALLIWDGVSRSVQIVNIYQSLALPVLINQMITMTIVGRKTVTDFLILNLTSFNFVDSNSGGNFSSPWYADPVAGIVAVNFTTGMNSGPTYLFDGFTRKPVNISVYVVPDASSTMICPPTVEANASTIICTLFPMNNGNPIWTLSSYYNLSDSLQNGTFSPLSSFFAPNFTFVYTPNPSSCGGYTQLWDAVSGASSTVLVYRAPDSSSNISCSTYALIPGATVWCTILPRWKGLTIWTWSVWFNPTIVLALGTTSASIVNGIDSGFATVFTFSVLIVSGMDTGMIAVSDGVSNGAFLVKVTYPPDSTSSIQCPPDGARIGSNLTCFLIPKKLGYQIYTGSYYFAPIDRLTGGTFSVLTGSYLNNYTVVYTASQVDGYTIIAAGGVPPFAVQTLQVWSPIDSTSTISCPAFVQLGVFAVCTITPKRSLRTVFSLSQFLQLVVVNGNAGMIVPSFANLFSFNYSANYSGSASVYASIGTAAANLLIWDVPDSSTIVNCPSVVLTSTVIVCTITPMRNYSLIWSLSSFFNLSDSANSVNAFSSVSPYYSNLFTFFYTTTAFTAPVNVSTGFNYTSIQIYDFPDNTSLLSCPVNVILGGSITCSIVARKAGVPIYAFATSFSPRFVGAGGSFLDVFPAFGITFYFNFSSTMETGVTQLSSGLGNLATVLIWDIPDTSSAETC